MITKVFSKIFGSKYERDYKRLRPIVFEINRNFEMFKKLSDHELERKTDEFRSRIKEGEKIDEILPEAFAVVKEVCRRLLGKKWSVCGIETTWDMVPFDVQLMGGIVLHEGKIAEMATGEGKTLVATMPIYLNALTGCGVHLVTVNDYLARRDSEWMGEIYKFLGLSVGCIQNQMDSLERKAQYDCDITYGTNNEFGFDYLRDNMAIRREDRVQRGHFYAIVDEVDSVLIDEARTPLIISGAVEHSTHKYDEMKDAVEKLVHNQTILVNKIISDGEKLLEEGKEREAGIKFLQAQRGAPKNKRLLKILNQEPAVKKIIQKTELEYLRDKKMHEIDEEMFFSIDEKSHIVDLTEKGRIAVSPKDPNLFVLPDLALEYHLIESDTSLPSREKFERRIALEKEFAEKSERVQNVSQLLRAYSLFEKDVEYVVSEGKVLIVDEFTGRLMPGRRYSDGLHQALEAKEGVDIERETQTLATITIQNYFRMYEKLAGMTGTAETEASELWHIYKLDVVVIPTNRPIRRVDYHDVVYKTRREKYNAIIDEIVRCNEVKRPVLVGTVSVEVSETLSRMLQRRGIKHTVLNAKYHQKEAEIIAFAGQPGAVTIATNMAGRGTDIKLGHGVVKSNHCCLIEKDGTGEVCPYYQELRCWENVPCGLHIIGTERHEARRIDRQLRGRSGRQGDPGSSRFYLSLEDDLMRLFGSERIASVMEKFGAEEGEVIEHPLVTKSIERAQKRVEAHNFDIRKHLLEYDDVMNKQREVIYELRNVILESEDTSEKLWEMIEDLIEETIEKQTSESKYPEEWNWDGLRQDTRRFFILDKDWREENINKEELLNKILESVKEQHKLREEIIGTDMMRQLERMILLQVIDSKWRDHLYSMDLMKEGIGLRAYGQKDPLLEYKQESYNMFLELTSNVAQEVAETLFKVRIEGVKEETKKSPVGVQAYKPAVMSSFKKKQIGEMSKTGKEGIGEEEEKIMPIRSGPKIGRNEPCPCGSGKKYKKCHGR